MGMLNSTIDLCYINVFFHKHTYRKGSMCVTRSVYWVRNQLVNFNHSKNSKVLKIRKKAIEIKKVMI